MSFPSAATLISGFVAYACALGSCFAQLPAFPGAEGEGRFVTGGRGGDVYHVTNLNDAGAGSLRFGIDSANGPRTIVFDISGTIELESTLRVGRPNITIAGQTAPGQGISIYNFGVSIQQPGVIVRHLRVRPGDARKGPRDEQGFSGDAISVSSSNVILDHVSASWAIDENLSVAGAGNAGITVQYSIISEGLDQTGLWHDEWNPDYEPGGTGHHSHGSLIKPTSGDGVITYHHNLWSNNWNRNPAVGTYATDQTLKVDLRNNVLYNNRSGGYSSGDSARVDMNYVGNYIISGPATSGSFDPFKARAANNMFIYRSDNKFDSNRNGVLDGSTNQQHIVTGDYTQLGAPVAMAGVTTDDVASGFAKVTADAGAFPWDRDPVDARLISQVSSQLGGSIIDSQEEVGGYPILPVVMRPANFDSDADGIPNTFEVHHGLNPNDPSDRNGTNLSPAGYTNLEYYLDALTTGVDNADFNEDGAVNGRDFLIWQRGFEIGSTTSHGDSDGDRDVDANDLGNWQAQYGAGLTAVPNNQVVPESASLALVAVTAVATATACPRGKFARRSREITKTPRLEIRGGSRKQELGRIRLRDAFLTPVARSRHGGVIRLAVNVEPGNYAFQIGEQSE